MHQDLVVTKSKVVGVVGAPNAGKTSLFNWMTGSHYRPINYPGSTVEYAVGQSMAKYGDLISIVDTPGVSSLNAAFPEEEVTSDLLFTPNSTLKISALISVVDATQLVRHLLLTRQLIEAGYSVLVALTMVDLLKRRGYSLDVAKLSSLLGVPVVVVDARLGGGVGDVFSAVRQVMRGPSPIHRVHWDQIQTESVFAELAEWEQKVLLPTQPKANQGSDDRREMADRNTSKDRLRADPKTLAIDGYLMHPVMGLFFFVLILGSLFSSVFWLAQPLMDSLDQLFSWLGEAASAGLPQGLLAEFVSDGLIAGIGSVVVFVPQIFILFVGLLILEDWGYLARAATLIDKPLSRLGLSGRSFVPLLSGFACAIPAMMSARGMGSKKERLLTLFIIPLMSCSARLPVYALLLAYLFQGQSPFLAGMVLAFIYLASMVVGAVAAALAGRFITQSGPSWFMLELPTYRIPRLSTVLRMAFHRTNSYLRRAGLPILIISIIIWCASVFPAYDVKDTSQRLSQSYAATAGQVLDPLLKPMGADWRVGVGLISAFAAREVFVASLALIFNLSDESEDGLQKSLLSAMQQAKTEEGETLFTFPMVAGLVVFFMIALQCLSTVVVSQRESGSLGFALLQLLIFTVGGWLCAVLVYQGLSFIGL